MQIRTDRGWIKAGLAVLVSGVLGGGVLTAAGGSRPPRKVTAEGVAGQSSAEEANRPFDLGGPPPAGAAEAPREDPEVGEKVPVGNDGGSVAVLAVEDNVSAGRLFGAGEGNKYIAAEVKGCSGPNEKNISFEPAYFLLRLDDGTVRDPGVPAKKPSLEGGKIPPGKCLSGWVTFTVKGGSLPTGVIYDGSSRLTWTVPLPKNAKPTTTTTMKPGATTGTTTSAGEESDGTKPTTSTTKPKATSTTATTAKSTATTARGSTATTPKATATTGKTSSSSSTTTTGKSSGSTTTTTKPSGSATTTSTSSSGTKSSGSTTTTTGKPAPAATTPTTSSTSGEPG